MSWTSIVAIYVLFWVLTAFVVLPIGVRTHDELGLAKIAGQADSAPGNFNPKLILLRTTLLSAVLFALWSVGALLVLGRLATGLLAVQWMRRRTDRVIDAPWLGIAR